MVMLFITGIVFSTLILSLIAFPFPALAQGPDFIPGKGEVVGVFGKIPGQDLIVHVWVVVPPGADKNEAANEALRNQGARPLTPAEFSTISLFWDQFSDAISGNDFVTQYYNPNNDPTEEGLGEPALLSTHSTWTAPTSKFALSYGGTTDRCPSLVKECRGPQFFDGFNDVAWLELKGGNTLAVTWSGTSIDEADVALNLNFDWATDGVNHFDAETIFLHENGHVAGLGHSEFQKAVMYPSYQEVRRALHQDDIDGIASLYPADPNNDPTEEGLGEPALLSTHSTWTAPTSKFALSYGGTTDRCPSLVKECRGPQFFDGFNDVAWLELKGGNTLAVTWSGTSIDEADVALNLNFDWATDGVNHFDAETIFLHENGHVAGLGHSEFQKAVMYPSYQEVRRALHQDDIDGIASLYPAVVDNLPTVSITTPLNDATILGMVTVSADASDDKGVSQLEFFVDGVSIGVETMSPYLVSWNTATGADGLHTVTATATDTIGQTASDSISVTVDNTVPTVSITSPAEAATVLGTIDITASAADVTSGVIQVEFFVDGTSIGIDTTFPYSMSWDTTTVTNGNHALTANAVDGAGNIDTSTSVVVAVNNPTVTTAGVDSITYQLEGGKSDNKHLNIIVHVIDGLGSSVSDASVSITLKNIDTGGSWFGTGLTGSDGIVIFSLKNAAFGCYTTTVTDVTAAGLTWDNSTPANEFCKE